MTFQIRDYQQELIDKTLQSMAKGNKRVLIQSAAGSGKSVTTAEIAKRSTDKGNRVLFVVHRRELVNQITETYRLHGVSEDLCLIQMVQTVTRKLDKIKPPDLIIVDEAHHSLAKTYRNIFDTFPDAYVIGVTATPIRLNGDGLGDVYEDLILGRAVEWLIDNQRLAPYEYYSIDLTNHDKLKKSSTGDYTYDSMTESLGDTIYGNIVEHYKKLADGEKAIAYCHNVEASRLLAEQFNDAGIPAMQVDGKTDKTTRKQAMDDFINGRIKILTNAELYGEGVDVPDCSVVILARPTESLSLFIQQSFRPMRYRPNKTATIIDHVGNVYRHGFPDMERKWSLDKKKKRKRKEVEAYPIWECEIDKDGCGMVFPKDDVEIVEFFVYAKSETFYYKKCPDCGHLFLIQQENEKKIDEEAELKKLEKEEAETEFYKRRNWRKATSYKELQEIGKANGYKPSWSAFKAKELGLADTPAWVNNYSKEPQFKLNF